MIVISESWWVNYRFLKKRYLEIRRKLRNSDSRNIDSHISPQSELRITRSPLMVHVVFPIAARVLDHPSCVFSSRAIYDFWPETASWYDTALPTSGLFKGRAKDFPLRRSSPEHCESHSRWRALGATLWTLNRPRYDDFKCWCTRLTRRG